MAMHASLHRGAICIALTIAAAIPAAGHTTGLARPTSAGNATPPTLSAFPAALVAFPAALPAAYATVAALPGLRLPSGTTAWVAPGEGRHAIDDFESAPWPDAAVWPLVSDLTGSADGEYFWAPSRCHAAGGSASLWAIGGGAAGAALACGAPYPPAQQTSAVLALDLSGLHSAGEVDLVFDVWADAEASEGLFINHLVFGPDGVLAARHIVYSATGHAATWSRDIRLDLTHLRDAHDPTWRMDLRGQRAYLELAFLSNGATGPGEGIFVDNLALDAQSRPPIIVTPVPPTATPVPVDRLVACGREPECKTIVVQAFDDYLCDGRYRRGLDFALRGSTRVDIVAGAEVLGAPLGTSDTLYFRVPMTTDAQVSVSAPAAYALCPGVANPRTVKPGDFGRKDFVKVVFGHYRN